MTSEDRVDDDIAGDRADARPDDAVIVLGRYRLDALLDNTRPWAELWLGHDLLLNRTVVVRLLDTDDDHTSLAIDAAREAAGFDDAHCVRVLDIAIDAAIPARGDLPASTCSVVVRAWVDGSSLGELLHDAPMDPSEAADLVADIAEVIARAHAAGLHHAQLDPQHVLLTRDGDVAVLDLGIAAALHAEDPNDLRRSDSVDDVRSLGALLYACLTGRWPLATPTPLDPATPINDAPGAAPLPPRRMRAGVPSALDALCRRALGETVAGQSPYDDARSFAVDLRRWLGRAGTSNSDLVSRRAATGAGGPRAGEATRDGRSRAARWVVGVIVVALLVGVAALGIQVLDAVFREPEGSPPPGPTGTAAP